MKKSTHDSAQYSGVPKMRSIREAAEELDFSAYRLRCLVKEEKIPALYCGVKAMVNLDEVREYLASCGRRSK